MTSESSAQITKPKHKWLKHLSAALVVTVLTCIVYVRTHPLVFNESFFSHAHCMPIVGLSLRFYADENSGRFPENINGYGDALVTLMRACDSPPFALTGPGYDPAVFSNAYTNSMDIPEAECGRIYVQGLSITNNPNIVLLFDKLPTPGGDHCHLLNRLRAPLGREAWTIGDGLAFVEERRWPAFAKNQIELLVKEGFDRSAAEQLYDEKGGVR
jgi:hypothetical protein